MVPRYMEAGATAAHSNIDFAVAATATRNVTRAAQRTLAAPHLLRATLAIGRLEVLKMRQQHYIYHCSRTVSAEGNINSNSPRCIGESSSRDRKVGANTDGREKDIQRSIKQPPTSATTQWPFNKNRNSNVRSSAGVWGRAYFSKCTCKYAWNQTEPQIRSPQQRLLLVFVVLLGMLLILQFSVFVVLLTGSLLQADATLTRQAAFGKQTSARADKPRTEIAIPQSATTAADGSTARTHLSEEAVAAVLQEAVFPYAYSCLTSLAATIPLALIVLVSFTSYSSIAVKEKNSSTTSLVVRPVVESAIAAQALRYTRGCASSERRSWSSRSDSPCEIRFCHTRVKSKEEQVLEPPAGVQNGILQSQLGKTTFVGSAHRPVRHQEYQQIHQSSNSSTNDKHMTTAANPKGYIRGRWENTSTDSAARRSLSSSSRLEDLTRFRMSRAKSESRQRRNYGAIAESKTQADEKATSSRTLMFACYLVGFCVSITFFAAARVPQTACGKTCPIHWKSIHTTAEWLFLFLFLFWWSGALFALHLYVSKRKQQLVYDMRGVFMRPCQDCLAPQNCQRLPPQHTTRQMKLFQSEQQLYPQHLLLQQQQIQLVQKQQQHQKALSAPIAFAIPAPAREESGAGVELPLCSGLCDTAEVLRTLQCDSNDGTSAFDVNYTCKDCSSCGNCSTRNTSSTRSSCVSNVSNASEFSRRSYSETNLYPCGSHSRVHLSLQNPISRSASFGAAVHPNPHTMQKQLPRQAHVLPLLRRSCSSTVENSEQHYAECSTESTSCTTSSNSEFNSPLSWEVRSPEERTTDKLQQLTSSSSLCFASLSSSLASAQTAPVERPARAPCAPRLPSNTCDLSMTTQTTPIISEIETHTAPGAAALTDDSSAVPRTEKAFNSRKNKKFEKIEDTRAPLESIRPNGVFCNSTVSGEGQYVQLAPGDRNLYVPQLPPKYQELSAGELLATSVPTERASFFMLPHHLYQCEEQQNQLEVPYLLSNQQENLPSIHQQKQKPPFANRQLQPLSISSFSPAHCPEQLQQRLHELSQQHLQQMDKAHLSNSRHNLLQQPQRTEFGPGEKRAGRGIAEQDSGKGAGLLQVLWPRAGEQQATLLQRVFGRRTSKAAKVFPRKKASKLSKLYYISGVHSRRQSAPETFRHDAGTFGNWVQQQHQLHAPLPVVRERRPPSSLKSSM